MANESAYDRDFESRLPTPLARLYRQAYLADSAFDRHLSAFYLWEATIKLIGSVAIAEWALGDERQPEIVELLQSLRKPTFVDWLEYLKQILPILAKRNHPTFEPIWVFVYRDQRQQGLPRTRFLVELLTELTERRRRTLGQYRVGELFYWLSQYRDQEIQLTAGAGRSEEFYDRVATALRECFAEIHEYLDPLGGQPLWVPVAILESDVADPFEAELVGSEPSDGFRRLADQTLAQYEFPLQLGPTNLSPLLLFSADVFDACFLQGITDSDQVELLCYSTGRVVALPLYDYRKSFLPGLLGIYFTELLGDEPDTPELAVPTRVEPIDLPGFSRLVLIGQGGMSGVYSAWQESLGREVVIKFLPLGMQSRDALARFKREAEIMGLVNHPNVVGIYQFITEGERVGIVMPYLRGRRMSDWLEVVRFSGIPERCRTVFELGLELASGLAAVHQVGWIHGDVKPANVILLDSPRKPVLIDFGLAKEVDEPKNLLTQAGAVVGTPAYMSPEQARGIDRSFPSDVFSFGILLWELLSDHLPFRADSYLDTMRMIQNWANDRTVRDIDPRIPKDFSAIVSKCLEPDPSRRYANAGELADDLRRCLNREPVRARYYSRRDRWLRFARRHRMTIFLVAGSALLSAGATAVAFLARDRRDLSVPPIVESAPQTTDPTGWYVAAVLGLLLLYQTFAAKRPQNESPAPAPKPEPVPPVEPKPVKQPIAPRPRVASSEEAFSSQTVVLRYPAPIAVAYRRFCARKEPRDRLAQLFDTFEITVKYLLYLAMSDLCAAHARKSPSAPLPKHQGFDFARRPTRMTVGQWVRSLRDAAQVLGKEKDRFFQELPEVCGPGGFLDKEIFGWIASNRNLVAHRKGGISLSSEKCVPLLREARPKLERLFQEIAFVRRYPLGFVTAGYPIGGGLKRYRVHSCLGARLAFGGDAFSIDSSAEFPLGVPFVVAPDDRSVLCLWPFLLQRESDVTQRPSLYVFEEIQEDAAFLTAVQSAAIDHEDDWLSDLHPTRSADHDWLWESLKKLPQRLEVPPELRLHEGISESLIGKLTGESLGKEKQYRLIAPIARGGFGTVYQAVDTRSETEVAVKVLEDRDGLDSGDDAVQFRRFQREFEKLQQAGKEHPGIVRCFESGNDILGRREYPWYSMEFASGGDLNARLLERRSRLGGKIVWELTELRAEASSEFRAIAGAVSHLHDLNIIHRDVKPANVLILDGGEIRLSDFGLVKETERSRTNRSSRVSSSRGAIVGTREYMAPEQERGEAVTKAADVYSLGVVLAELLTGHRPEPETKVTAGSLIEKDPHLDRLPEPLRRLILDCSDLEPQNRPRDAHDLLHRFELAVK